MKPNFKTEMDRTRSSVAEIVGWCLVVALNQEMGIGAKRLNRCAEAAIRIQEQYISVIDAKGLQCAMSQMQKDVADLCDADFRVPLRRSARNRREQQLRIAGDQAATIEWCIWARAAHEVLGLGPKRLHSSGRQRTPIIGSLQTGRWRTSTGHGIRCAAV